MLAGRPAVQNMSGPPDGSVPPTAEAEDDAPALDLEIDAGPPVDPSTTAVGDAVQRYLAQPPDHTEPSNIGELKRDEDFPPGGLGEFVEGVTDGGVDVEVGAPQFVSAEPEDLPAGTPKAGRQWWAANYPDMRRQEWDRDAALEQLLSKLDLGGLAK